MFIIRNGMLIPKTWYLEAFARIILVEYIITRMHVLFGLIYEEAKRQREECCILVFDTLHSFEILPQENTNGTYSWLNILIEEVNVLEFTQLTQSNVLWNFLSASPSWSIHYYSNTNLDICAHERSNKKNLALQGNHEKIKWRMLLNLPSYPMSK